MKKILSIAFVVVLVFALASVAFADAGPFSVVDGCVVGTYTAEGSLVDIWVNGNSAKADIGSVSIKYSPAADVNTVVVYVDGAVAATYTVEAAPVVVPTEVPVEPTEAPVEPTQAPVEPTQAPVEPTKAPETPKSSTAPANPTSSTQKDSVPKTGEMDVTAIVIAALAIAMIGAGVVVVTKKHGKEN